jgi:PiT family inorganic phosphate transporter
VLLMEWLLVAAALLVAFSNGANDNFKGFATVWGSQTLSYRQALGLATLATAAGSVASLTLANALV